QKSIFPTLEQNKQYLEEHAGLGQSFDLLAKDMEIGTKKVLYFYVNGFVKDDVMTDIMARLSYLKREEVVPSTLKALLLEFIPHNQVEEVHEMDELVTMVYAGASALFIHGESTALLIDVKTFPVRGIEE